MFDAAAQLIRRFTPATASCGLRRLGFIFLLLPLLLLPDVHAATTVTSARVWPAPEYTRVTFESATPIAYQLLLLLNYF